MVNNTEQIRELLFFEKDAFYFIEVIQRRKENPELKRHANTIADFYVSSLESFDKKLPDIVQMCDFYNARAYIRLNYRSYETVAMNVNLKTAELLVNKNFKAVMSVYPSVVGETKGCDWRKFRLIDLDGEEVRKSASYIYTINKLAPEAQPFIIPTQNGLHIISGKFDTKRFRLRHPEVANEDIKQDANTILYQA